MNTIFFKTMFLLSNFEFQMLPLFRILSLSSLVSGFPSNAEPNLPKLEPSSFIVKVLENGTPVKDSLNKEDLLKPNSAIVTCIGNERVTSKDHFQDTRLMKFTLENLNYDPGDVLVVRPQNSDQAVNYFFELFKNRKDDFNENSVVNVSKNIENIFIPPALDKPVAFKNVIKEYFNLDTMPRRYTLEIFWHFTDREEERQNLMKFMSAEGTKEFYKRFILPKRTVLEVLEEFPGVVEKIPIDYLFEIFQDIKPRSYSIASSPKVHKDEIHLLVAVVNYKTDLDKPRSGLCSTWLASFQNGSKAAVYLAKGLLSFPKSKDSPTMIMVGPGTGIAPFRSYVHQTSDSNETDKNYVFFGCRSQSADYYFADEWDTLQKENKTHLFAAFSRDQPEKIYVQHIIEKNAELMWKLIAHRNASIYVAGNAINMPNEVKKAFISSYSSYGNVSQTRAEEFFMDMETNGRYQTETW
ncbi:NADPH-dependent diflavin oxidoreductase 1-like [Planococcus citri]|uniref:NADPH-dependent diflavin oxidoreductase 1-like n=1 Tax=Planococcus citri TaxID=170843 RepID=UPI0031F8AF90